jgi:zinc transporter, ZIP family
VAPADNVVRSIALGFASGVLLATVSFEMVPQALEKAPLWRVLGWTALIGGAVFVSALCGALLRDIPQQVIGALFALGAGGIFYLTVTQLIPQAEEQQYQQSAALAIALGFVVILMLTRLL